MDEDVNTELVKFCKKILNQEIDPIFGCRKICSLRWMLENSDDNIFVPFRVIVSETDHFLIGDVRDYADLDYLKRLDLEKSECLDDEKEFIFTSCRNLISWCQNEE